MSSLKFFFHAAQNFGLKDAERIKHFLQEQLEKVVAIDEVHFWFMDNETIQSINRKHLKHDYPTDNITFVYEQNPLYADCCIGAQTVKENAKRFSSTQQQEFLRVIFHACLHALGQKDKTPSERKKMTKKENEWIKHFSNC